MHVITKNLQSIRDERRLADFMSELDSAMYDILFGTETWRAELEEFFETPGGHVLYTSGGSTHRGVCIALSKSFRNLLQDITFHSISQRLCALKFRYAGARSSVFCCYFPTSWDADDAVIELYETLTA